MIPDDEFIEAVRTRGIAEAARHLGIAVRNVATRRRSMEKKYGIVIKAVVHAGAVRLFEKEEHPTRVRLDIKDGMVLIGSDAHYWPDHITTAHRAFVHFCKKYKPVAVIMNGDMLDGASISRHPPIGWEHRPSLIQEIETVSDRLDEILKAAPNAKRAWPLGNHDARFSTRLASVAPEYAKVKGVQLKDHFPGWQPCWSVWINDDVVIKHRYKNGVHAVYNSTVYSGKTLIHGHLHSQKVSPFTDYNGTRWGVDCGTMADTFGPQFEGYMEDNARNWVSGFVALTFRGGELLTPEKIRVAREGVVDFRGELIQV